MLRVTSEYILAKTVRDFKIEDSSWYKDAIDWIGDAIEGIGYHCGFINKAYETKSRNHRAELPCDLISLYGVVHCGYRLPIGSDTSGLFLQCNEKNECCNNMSDLTDEMFLRLKVLYSKLDVINLIEEPTADDLNDKEDILKEITDINSSCKLSNSCIDQCVLPYYNVNADFIQTSFSEGNITILYKAFQLDDKGFPMIIDSYKYRNAVMWFLIMKTLLQGYIHPNIDYKLAKAEWEDYRHKASNEQKMPSLDQLERFHNRWHSIKRGANLGSISFQGAEREQGSLY